MRMLALLFMSITWLAAGGAAANELAATNSVRVATFNIAMGLREEGDLARALASGKDERLRQVAGILRRVNPDIVLLTEFDYDPAVDAARLFNQNYLAVTDSDRGISYPHHFRAAVNTGVDSGLDLDMNGATGTPGDAWGFGRFPGQYGMLVLSRFPIDTANSRSFQHFRWAAMPGARRPLHPDGSPFHDEETWQQLRLSSKSHWDLQIDIGGEPLHLLAHHPTPPVFDGPEDRNGARNHDEIRFWLDYTSPAGADYIVDDSGVAGGIADGARFVIAGDFNADPHDGDAAEGAVGQLLNAPWVDAGCVPLSAGGAEAAAMQGGVNSAQRGDPAADTSDFNDERAGNLRLDYVLPSRNLDVNGCGVHWPATAEDGHRQAQVSDHRLVWLDISL
jgi:endonuclease/exonuclease/phosphatase family metal-dependent hydrolase